MDPFGSSMFLGAVTWGLLLSLLLTFLSGS